jgi:hypothetical protein
MATKAKKPAESEEPTVALVAVEPIRHDGVDYAPGDSLIAGELAAAALIASGAASADSAA